MKYSLKENVPVLTSDEYKLGQTHTLYHRQLPARPEHDQFASYLMVVNMTIGDEYYVPTTYVDESKSDETAVWLTLTRDDIQEKQLTRLPQFVVDNQFHKERLADAGSVPDKGKPFEEIMPLPPNLSAKENESA